MFLAFQREIENRIWEYYWTGINASGWFNVDGKIQRRETCHLLVCLDFKIIIIFSSPIYPACFDLVLQRILYLKMIPWCDRFFGNQGLCGRQVNKPCRTSLGFPVVLPHAESDEAAGNFSLHFNEVIYHLIIFQLDESVTEWLNLPENHVYLFYFFILQFLLSDPLITPKDCWLVQYQQQGLCWSYLLYSRGLVWCRRKKELQRVTWKLRSKKVVIQVSNSFQSWFFFFYLICTFSLKIIHIAIDNPHKPM